MNTSLLINLLYVTECDGTRRITGTSIIRHGASVSWQTTFGAMPFGYCALRGLDDSVAGRKPFLRPSTHADQVRHLRHVRVLALRSLYGLSGPDEDEMRQ